jgi:3-phosphoshikimate 1-carboxyvinyltransferase
MLAALADGTSRVRGFLASEDCLATLETLRHLAVPWQLEELAGSLVVQGTGLKGLHEPDDVLDCKNSGTTMRLVAGILAGQPFTSILSGDESLRGRPMDRIITPLRSMGAQITGRAGDTLPPIVIRGGELHGLHYTLPVASAQVKSAVLLAGLFAEGDTTVEEPAPTRDHTERMLRAMGADVRREGPAVRISPPERLSPLDLRVPGDFSSAAFWIVAASAHPDAEILLTGVGTNPTRTGLLDVMATMGSSIELLEPRMIGEEPVADIRVRSAQLEGCTISGELSLRSMDELPVLAVAAASAKGTTVVRDASELRVKESDRIASLAPQLRAFGVKIEETPDGFIIEGGHALRGAHVSGGGDHRITMALATAGLLADGESNVEDTGEVAISYPAFWHDLQQIGGHGNQ